MAGVEGGGGVTDSRDPQMVFYYPSRTQPVGVNSLQLQVIMLRGRKAFSPLNTPNTNA